MLYSSFSHHKLDASKLFYIFHSFRENCTMHKLQEVILKIIFCIIYSLVFKWMYGFNHVFWMNCILLLFFFYFLEFMIWCLCSYEVKVLMCTTYYFSIIQTTNKLTKFPNFNFISFKNQFKSLHCFLRNKNNFWSK